MTAADMLRPPGAIDPTRSAYKDWLHLNLFDVERDRSALINVSVHGAPGDATTQVVTTALGDDGGSAWLGQVDASTWADASVTATGIGTRSGAVALVDDGLLAACSFDDLRIDVHASPISDAYTVATAQPFGSGWIDWRVVPQLSVTAPIGHAGRSSVAGWQRGQVTGYHDHNWGRWHWGDDIGWEWGSFLDGAGTSVVVARTTDRAHVRCGPWSVVVDHGARRRTFSGRRVFATWSGSAPSPSRRLPGALAAQHADRRHPRLPGRFELTSRSGSDWLRLTFRCRSVAQLILADTVVNGRSFLHELSGQFDLEAEIHGHRVATSGLAMMERLE